MGSSFSVDTLSLSELRSVQQRMDDATERLNAILASVSLDREAFQAALGDGARFESWLSPQGKGGVWEWVLSNNRLDLFEDLLEADAHRPCPDARTPRLGALVAYSGNQRCVEAWLARQPPLNRLGPSSFLADPPQDVPAVLGALLGAQDAVLDRLVEAGADLAVKLGVAHYPHKPGRPPPKKLAPLSLIHAVRTAHAVRRVVAAGVHPDTPDEEGRTPLERIFVRLGPDFSECGVPWFSKEEAIDVGEALLDAGASPAGTRKDGWNVVVGACRSNLVPWVHALQRNRGLGWPAEHPPELPDVALEYARAGVNLPWAAGSAAWLNRWVARDEEYWSRADRFETLQRLAGVGLDLNAPDPQTGLTPLVTALRVGSYAALSALVRAGANLRGYPGAAWDRRMTWGSLLSKTIYGCVGFQTRPGSEHWAKLKIHRQDGDKLKAALQELGHHPAVVGEPIRALLDNGLVPDASVKPKSRLRI